MHEQRKHYYNDQKLQGYLITALITIELLLVIVLLAYLLVEFNRVIDARMYRIHSSHSASWPEFVTLLARAMGAFFVRRKSGNPLYRRVLERYIHMATREGVCQAVFLEGGLSRDGALREPKLGLMDYMLRQYDLENDRDIVFIPVGINYDRTLEDRSLVRSLDPEAEKRSWWFVIRTTAGFIGRSFFLMIVSRWRRYGYAGVNFGAPVSIKNYCDKHNIDFSRLERKERFAAVDTLCHELMHAIAGVVPILPLAILFRVM